MRIRGLFLVVGATFALTPLAHAGLIISPFYDSSVTSRADYAEIQTAFNYAASQFSDLYSDNITINITVKADAAVGLGQWPGVVRSINGATVPESLAIEAGFNSTMFAGLNGKHFVFNNPLAVTEWTLEVYGAFQKPAVSYAVNGERLISAVENGPLSAVQFHPERSGDAGVQLLRNWLGTL